MAAVIEIFLLAGSSVFTSCQRIQIFERPCYYTMVATAAQDGCVLDTLDRCRYDPEAIDRRFANDPLTVAGRIATIVAAVAKIKLANDDGATLRAELSRLGPVFCKVGQTLATRPDIVGLETSRNLGKLQNAMAPEPDAAIAMATVQKSLGGTPLAQAFPEITPAPIAAASLAEVYKATLANGRQVAVKVQRPGLELKVALDLYCARRLLELAQKQFKIGGDVSVVVAVLDEVGSGLFDELDFTVEAANIRRFQRLYGRACKELGVVVPAVVEHLTSTRVLVTEWMDGVPPRELPPTARAALASTAVRCLAMQLMTHGFIHCDPHEGNLLALRDGRVALIDFGLMAQMRLDHMEAMAHGVLNIMGENYEALVPIFRGMGVLADKEDLRRPGTEEPFPAALRRCMSGEASEAADAATAVGSPAAITSGSKGDSASSTDRGRRRKLIQDTDGTDRRRAFGQLYEELSELAFKYYFTIPSYYILVMRAFVTLEGIALSADEQGSFNMYSVTAPYARRKLFTPKTKVGRTLLRTALFTPEGRRAMQQGMRLSWPRRLRLPRWLRPWTWRAARA